MTREVIDALRAFAGVTVEPCGSHFTCDPPVMDTDKDYLVECYNRERICSFLEAAGYVREGVLKSYDSEFVSMRLGDYNFLVTDNEDFADRHRAATHVCKKLNLLNKSDRIMVFQAVLYGNIR
jgi:hypothetical protein